MRSSLLSKIKWEGIYKVKHPNGRVVVFRIPGRPKGTAYAYEGAYLMGMAAAELTKTKKLGVVSAFAIPELISTT